MFKKFGLLETLLTIIISASVIGTAVYRFDYCKVDKEAFAALEAKVDVNQLEGYRRALQQRIWDIKREYPNTYQQKREYQELIQDLKNTDEKIKAYYKKKG